MTNLQMWVAVVIPTIAVLVGILLNHNGISHLAARLGSIESHLGARIGSVESRLTAIEGDLRRFYQVLGEHSARLDNLEKSPRR